MLVQIKHEVLFVLVWNNRYVCVCVGTVEKDVGLCSVGPRHL